MDGQRRLFVIFGILFLLCRLAISDIQATTTEGKQVILKNDGTWTYLKSPTGAQLLLVNHKAKRESPNYVKLTGRVQNISKQPIGDLLAVTSFFDRAGEFITREQAMVDIDPIESGQISTFGITVKMEEQLGDYQITFSKIGGKLIPHSEETTKREELSCRTEQSSAKHR